MWSSTTDHSSDPEGKEMTGRSSLLLLLALLAVVPVVSAPQDDPPTYIVWPKQWHADVMIADNGFWPFQNAISVAGKGSFFYDSTRQVGSYALIQLYTGRRVHEVINSTGVYVVDGPTGSCSIDSVSDSVRYTLPSSFSPDFLSKHSFKFIGWEYYLRDDTYFETLHWQLPGDLITSTTIDYWHATATDTPYRIAWEGVSPIILEFSGVVAGFDDVANIKYFLTAPSSCNSASETRTATSKVSPGHTTPLKGHKDHGTHPPSPQVSSGKAWPFQWHGASHFTGNVFGGPFPLSASDNPLRKVGEEGDPTTVPFSLSGHYYYDWLNQRECNVWMDVNTGARTNTLIVNGTFHIITLATNSCQLIPTYPVNGPLKPDWPTRLPYSDMQYILVQAERPNYIKTNHYLYDAFGAGPKHSFNYWETQDTQSPVQFQGPVLEIWPYGQSMMRWENVVMGLNGLPLETEIFYVPNDCSYIPADQFLSGEDDSQISPAIRSLFLHHMILLTALSQ